MFVFILSTAISNCDLNKNQLPVFRGMEFFQNEKSLGDTWMYSMWCLSSNERTSIDIHVILCIFIEVRPHVFVYVFYYAHRCWRIFLNLSLKTVFKSMYMELSFSQ